MKYILPLALATTLLAGVSAKAADIDPAPAPVVEEAHDWRGSYFGIQGGYVFGSDATVGVNGIAGPIVVDADSDLDGVHGGVFGGYNFQSGNIVFGLDNDFSFTSAEADFDPDTIDLRTLSSVRGRVGFAFDRVLPYVTGGLAYGNVRARLTGTNFSDSQFQFGWTAGAGDETALTDYISARVQYTYTDLGSDEFFSGTFAEADIDLGGIHTCLLYTSPSPRDS